MKRLGTQERKVLRMVYGPVVEQGIWRIRTNQELRKPHKDLDIVANINTLRKGEADLRFFVTTVQDG